MQMGSHMTVPDVLPQLEPGCGEVDLGGHVAGLGDGHLEDQAATVIGDAPHHVETSGGPGDPDVVLQNPGPLQALQDPTKQTRFGLQIVQALRVDAFLTGVQTGTGDHGTHRTTSFRSRRQFLCIGWFFKWTPFTRLNKIR